MVRLWTFDVNKYKASFDWQLSMLCEGVCPAVCSGNGEYQLGRCKCHPGWTGDECQLPSENCAGVYCSQHGQCVDGRCVCTAGFTGIDCFQGLFYCNICYNHATDDSHWSAASAIEQKNVAVQNVNSYRPNQVM